MPNQLQQETSRPKNTSNQVKDLQQSLFLLNQKDQIIQKFIQKINIQEEKISSLSSEIQRLNWISRQNQYRNNQLKIYSVKDLIKEGYLKEFNLYEQNTHQHNQQSETNNQVKKYLLQIIIDSETQQIQLNSKMTLIQTSQGLFGNNEKSGKQDMVNVQQITSYCRQVLQEVQQLKRKMQLQQKQKQQISENLQIKISQLEKVNEQLKSQLEESLKETQELKQKYNKLSHSRVQTTESQCQTEAFLMFQRGDYQIHVKSPISQIPQSKVSLPPPSLDLIVADFQNSQSSEAPHMRSTLTKIQHYSNLSSSSFGKEGSQTGQQMITLTNKNKVLVNQETKHESLRDIGINHVDHIVQHHTLKEKENNKPQNNDQNFVTPGNEKQLQDDFPTNLPEIGKKKTFSQKHIIIEDPNEDEDAYEGTDKKIKSKTNLQNSKTPTKNKQSQSPQKGKQSSQNIQRDPQLAQYDYQSETYKNSLRFESDKIQGNQLTYNNFTSPSFKSSMKSKSVTQNKPQKVVRHNSLAQKASEILDMKSPENIMKSIIRKKFPIQTNPFKLSNQYLNVAQLISQQQPQHQQSNQKIEQHKKKQKTQQDQQQTSLEIKLPSPYDSPQHSRTLEKQPFSAQQTQSQNNNGHGTSNGPQTAPNLVNPSPSTKTDFIDIADSVDFSTLKKLQNKHKHDSTGKKKPKTIYIRR